MGSEVMTKVTYLMSYGMTAGLVLALLYAMLLASRTKGSQESRVGKIGLSISPLVTAGASAGALLGAYMYGTNWLKVTFYVGVAILLTLPLWFFRRSPKGVLLIAGSLFVMAATFFAIL